MSLLLVDYGPSSDDDEELQKPSEPEVSQPGASTDAEAGVLESSSNGASASGSQSQQVVLPDASELFAPSGGRTVTAAPTAGSDSSSRKRTVPNGSANQPLEAKQPRRNFPRQSDGGGGQLLPPQLRGRSNIVTDDIDKLFVRRPREG